MNASMIVEQGTSSRIEAFQALPVQTSRRLRLRTSSTKASARVRIAS